MIHQRSNLRVVVSGAGHQYFLKFLHDSDVRPQFRPITEGLKFGGGKTLTWVQVFQLSAAYWLEL